ncbi:hypothetical protein AN963_01870 [Brevibacillus choshinensis]|uniref:Uncharacterized protein n=1 Tax=Brevibacillus choshinensis TaxID=54911 RepID=A0ABR5NAK3_BRECH|nr:hypothetical protein AN963_01870 [Brevibacillus choshinensis]
MEDSRLAEEKGEISEDLWGTRRSGMGKEKHGLKRTPLRFTRESAALDAVSLYLWRCTGMTPSRGPKKLERFLLFPLLHHSLIDHQTKGRGRSSRVFLIMCSKKYIFPKNSKI